jgi:phage terminase small subunit
LSTEHRPPAAPKGLQLVGKRMWKRVVSAYKLRPDEVFVLESACRTADWIAKLEAAMEGQPLVVKGSMGQDREHPLLSEARQQRALLARLLAQLKLPDEDGLALETTSTKARTAAMSRWSRPGA